MKHIIFTLGVFSIILIYSIMNTDIFNGDTNKSEFIGKWELKGEGYGDIVPPIDYCCEFIEFYELGGSQDILYKYIVDNKVEAKDTFSINIMDKIITHKGDGNISYSYKINSDILEISYTTDNNVRHWSKYRKVN